jgi:hypothetical protein
MSMAVAPMRLCAHLSANISDQSPSLLMMISQVRCMDMMVVAAMQGCLAVIY